VPPDAFFNGIVLFAARPSAADGIAREIGLWPATCKSGAGRLLRFDLFDEA